MRWTNLPNLLTLSRLVLVPFAVTAIAAGDYRRALAIFVVAAATDGLDGFLARRFGWLTRIGAYLDPVADKALLNGAWLALGIAGAAPIWLVALVFGRDLLILAMVAAAILFTKYRSFPPSMWGKISTFLQIAGALVALVHLAFPRPELEGLARPLLWLVAAGTAWSGVDYIRRAVVTLLNKRETPVH
ncbi:MAG TPA: CDP-alcohol phosphatidyltransferase family protein [Bryobacteraceae bacterium]|nr:CDP-alcohol phosphatidyltransferase family protein [Bryobacteraceae bacterium]